jgi:hypothetical protein
MPIKHTFTSKVVGDDNTVASAIPLTFDPVDVFGRLRVPVVVDINGYTFRSTIFKMCGECFVPLRQSHRDGAGAKIGQRVSVTLTEDDKPRTIAAPAVLKKALKAAGLEAGWKKLSFTHQREHVEAITQAKKPETRERRITKCLEMLNSKHEPRPSGSGPARRPSNTSKR